MKLDFCTACGAELSAQDDTHYKCVNGHDYFNNPRAATAIILINDKDELLFAERARNPQKGKYDFPGGFVDFGETAETAARRELQEELGVESQRLELITTIANRYDELTTTVDCIYICRAWTNEILPADDVASISWQPVSFIETSAFAWPEGYKDLPQTLHDYLQNNRLQ
jgi:mutator protein MutT